MLPCIHSLPNPYRTRVMKPTRARHEPGAKGSCFSPASPNTDPPPPLNLPTSPSACSSPVREALRVHPPPVAARFAREKRACVAGGESEAGPEPERSFLDHLSFLGCFQDISQRDLVTLISPVLPGGTVRSGVVLQVRNGPPNSKPMMCSLDRGTKWQELPVNIFNTFFPLSESLNDQDTEFLANILPFPPQGNLQTSGQSQKHT